MNENALPLRERLNDAGDDPARRVLFREIRESLARTETDLGRRLTGAELREVLGMLRDSRENPAERRCLSELLPAGEEPALVERLRAAFAEIEPQTLADVPTLLARIGPRSDSESREAAGLAGQWLRNGRLL